jgi:hypothetical protein
MSYHVLDSELSRLDLSTAASRPGHPDPSWKLLEIVLCFQDSSSIMDSRSSYGMVAGLVQILF